MQTITDSANLVVQSKLREIDRQWELERKNLLIGPMGDVEPCSGWGIAIWILAAFLGGFITLLALLDFTEFLELIGNTNTVFVVVPIFLLFLLFGVLFGFVFYKLGKRYEVALDNYHKRRAAAQLENSGKQDAT